MNKACRFSFSWETAEPKLCLKHSHHYYFFHPLWFLQFLETTRLHLILNCLFFTDFSQEVVQFALLWLFAKFRLFLHWLTFSQNPDYIFHHQNCLDFLHCFSLGFTFPYQTKLHQLKPAVISFTRSRWLIHSNIDVQNCTRVH